MKLYQGRLCFLPYVKQIAEVAHIIELKVLRICNNKLFLCPSQK